MEKMIKKVVAGLLLSDNKVLIGQRKKGTKDALKWEFPGGKIEAHEELKEALVREFKEELGIDVFVDKHLGDVEYSPELHFYFYSLRGDLKMITLLEHEAVKFVNFTELLSYDLCLADRIFINSYQEIIKQFID